MHIKRKRQLFFESIAWEQFVDLLERHLKMANVAPANSVRELRIQAAKLHRLIIEPNRKAEALLEESMAGFDVLAGRPSKAKAAFKAIGKHDRSIDVQHKNVLARANQVIKDHLLPKRYTRVGFREMQGRVLNSIEVRIAEVRKQLSD